MRQSLIETLKNKGICQYIQEIIDLDWFTVDVADNLDTELYYNKSIFKIISPLMNHELSVNDYDTAMQKIAHIIVMKFRSNWENIYKAYFETKYNALENFTLTENENVGSQSKVYVNGNNKEYAFNSSDGKDTNENSQSVTNESNFDDNKRKLTKSGLSGSTSQEMLKAEIELREYDFYNKVLQDIDSVICLGIYK